MRFRGGAIGHKSTRKATVTLEEQNDVPAAENHDPEDDDEDGIDTLEIMEVDNED